MRIARFALAGLLAAMLVVSVGYDWWSDRPYIVTGISVSDRAGILDLSLRYTIPGSGTGEWSMEGQMAAAALACWRTAQIGARLPDCIRTFDRSTAN